MKKKILIAMLAGTVILGSIIIIINNKKTAFNKVLNTKLSDNNEVNMENSEKAENNNEIATESDEKSKEDEKNVENNNAMDNKTSYKEDSDKVNTIEDADKSPDSLQSKSNTNISSNNNKEKEQTIDEGYKIFYKAREAYEREDFNEAIRLYETITNKDAIAKVRDEKYMFYFRRDIDEKINEGQKLYDSGKYLDAKIFISKLIQGNSMMPKQEVRANELLKKSESKVSVEEENNVNNAFTYEKALEILKKKIGDNSDNIYSYFQEHTNPYGFKQIHISVDSKSKPETGMIYLVGSDGSVIEGS